MKKRIDEIDMIKGILILFVVISHVAGFAGIRGLYPIASNIISTLVLIAMVTFYILSGYTYNQGSKTLMETIGKRIKSIVLPYYAYAIPMLVFLFVFFILFEHRTMNWFLDGVLAVLLQLQSTYIFSDGVLVHEMMYSVFACWFIFQLLVAFIVFIPVYRLVENKKLYVKLIAALVLLGLGALFYSLDIQKLNGEFFPAVCKMLVLPNIFGIAGLLMIGKCASLIELLDMKRYSGGKRLISVIASVIVIVVAYATDDYIYDFPIGKWGAFGEISYFTTPVYGIALMVLLGCLVYEFKKNETVKKSLVFFGKNSLDFLILHFFIVWFISYVCGIWAPANSDKVIPSFEPPVIWAYFIFILFITLTVCSVTVIIRNHRKNK